jgi:hypothetical protein
VEAPTSGFLCGGVGASAFAGAANASVAVVAATIELATRAEVQDIKKAPLSLDSWESQVPRPDPLLGSVLRCGDHARFWRFPSAFRPLSVVHPPMHHRPLT